MSNFQHKYKSQTFGFANQDVSRFIRAENDANRRKTVRTKTFNENRNILDNSINATLTEEAKTSPAVENRATRLLKWKINRNIQKKLDQAKKKRPFIVGKVRHKVYSPITKDEHITSKVASKMIHKSTVESSTLPKRITRATEKRLIRKAQLNTINNIPMKTDNSVKNKQSKLSKKQEQSFAPADYKFKPPGNLKRLPLFGRVTNSISDCFNELLSPIVAVSRVSTKSCVTNFPAQPISSTLNTSYTIEKKLDDGDGDGDGDNNTEEDSITLKLSSDDEKVFNSSNKRTSRSKKNNDDSSNNVSKKDIETNEKFNDSKKNEKFNDSKKNGNFNDSKKSEKLNDSEKNKKLTDSEENEKFNNSKKNEKLNDSKKNKKLNDSNQSKKFNNFNKNEDINQKLNNSYTDNELNITKIINDSKDKDAHHIVETSEKTQPSFNNDKSVFLSPYAVSSRGKTNARKEQQTKSGFNLNCTTNDCMQTKEEERMAQYFELLLNKEIDKQSQLCEKWSKIKEEPGITEDAQYQINQAIGQTNLLMNKKFVKFRNLVSDCATGAGEMLVTCNDLQGFWDMMYIEVDDCNLRFQKLEQLRSRGWEEEEVIVINKPPRRKKVAAKKKTVRTNSNGIGAVLAKRKQNMVEGTQNNTDTKNPGILSNETLSSKYENNENSPNCKNKSRTPNKTRLSVLRQLQFSDTKKYESPLTMIKISQMCKTPEIQLDSTISYINSHQTPSRSILKQLKHSNEMGSCMKSTHNVNFNDNAVSKNEDGIKNLAVACAKIDNVDFDCISHETYTGKKLTFNDDSFEDSSNMFTQKNIAPIKIEVASPLKKSMLDYRLSTPSSSRKWTRQNVFCKDDGSPSLDIVVSTPFKEVVNNTNLNESKQKLQKHVSINEEQETAEQQSDNRRVLRNRSIILGNTPTQKKRYSRNLSMNVQELEYKENKTPTNVKSKNLNKENTKDDTLVNSEVDLYDAIRGMSIEEKYGRRRSSRKSIKFSEKECSGCAEKLTFSVTPHARRSRAQSTEKKRSVVTKESTETTEKLPERVHKSRQRVQIIKSKLTF